VLVGPQFATNKSAIYPNWVIENLHYDSDNKQLHWNNNAPFTETSYLLFRFAVSNKKFTVDNIYYDNDLQSDFKEARRIEQVRDSKIEKIHAALEKSFNRDDIHSILDALNQYIYAPNNCNRWDEFWYSNSSTRFE
jgi:hypothetical protein